MGLSVSKNLSSEKFKEISFFARMAEVVVRNRVNPIRRIAGNLASGKGPFAKLGCTKKW